MNILFLHNNYPAQFRHVATHYARDPENKVIFVTDHVRPGIEIPGVVIRTLKTGTYKFSQGESDKPDELLNMQLEKSIQHAKGLYKLKQQGFVPDLIYDHSGWGMSLFVQDIFPDAAYASFFEWYYNKGTDYAFAARGKERPPSDFMNGRLRNLCQLNALAGCDVGITPTKFQKSTYPKVFQTKLEVVHDGIDTAYFAPNLSAKFSLPGLDLRNAKEIVTYATRGLEPYRGFPQFYKALPALLAERPDCHVVIMADDRSCYGGGQKNSVGYGERLRKEHPLDPKRVHFLPMQPYDIYRALLQASTVHVYLTVPFVLSWSLLEAMSCGCLVVASNTEPVLEVVRHERNGLLTDFWNPSKIARSIITALERRNEFNPICLAARRTITKHYDLNLLLPKQIALLNKAAKSKKK